MDKQITLTHQEMLDVLNASLKAGGVNYLLANWDLIHKIIAEIFAEQNKPEA